MPADPFANPEELVRRVYAYVAYRIGHGPDAEDVAGDVLERALRYRASFDRRKGDALSWLIGIARRQIEDQRTKRTFVLAEPESVAAPGDLEEDTALRLTLAAAVAGLDARDRELIALRYGAGLNPREMAELLEVRRNAVDVALHRARARLRVLLEEPRVEAAAAEGSSPVRI